MYHLLQKIKSSLPLLGCGVESPGGGLGLTMMYRVLVYIGPGRAKVVDGERESFVYITFG